MFCACKNNAFLCTKILYIPILRKLDNFYRCKNVYIPSLHYFYQWWQFKMCNFFFKVHQCCVSNDNTMFHKRHLNHPWSRGGYLTLPAVVFFKHLNININIKTELNIICHGGSWWHLSYRKILSFSFT